MSDYAAWNEALLAYFTQGLPRGAAIFLAVDDAVLVQVARGFLRQSANQSAGLAEPELDAEEDFRRAVREKVVFDDRVDVLALRERTAEGTPQCVAFLCTMVLAAVRMADEGEVSDINYFARLREVLGLPTGEGRPTGMRFGSDAEEPLWRTWNLWLQEQGFLPSARPGAGPHKYITYPLSQALLRSADRDHLARLFAEKGWGDDSDVDALTLRLRRQVPYVTRHLRELLSATGQRGEAAMEAIHEFYELWREDPQVSGGAFAAGRAHLRAGIFRHADLITGEVDYALYPAAPRRRRAASIRVRFGEISVDLTEDRPGWFCPVGRIEGETLSNGARYPVESPPDFDALLLAARRAWPLVPDPDDPTSGAFASWGPPQLGEPFLLLLDRALLPDLERLRAEGLVQWTGGPIDVLGGRWVELHDIMAVAESWPDDLSENHELAELLRPRTPLNISFAGGLRVPGRGGWLAEHGPLLTVWGFDAEADIAIFRADDETPIWEQTCRTGERFTVPWPGPGDFRAEASASGREAPPRLVKLLPWEELWLVEPEQPAALVLGDWRVRGAAIERAGGV